LAYELQLNDNQELKFLTQYLGTDPTPGQNAKYFIQIRIALLKAATWAFHYPYSNKSQKEIQYRSAELDLLLEDPQLLLPNQYVYPLATISLKIIQELGLSCIKQIQLPYEQERFQRAYSFLKL
jgi:hypothetical protein